jgi:hypothetical protein
VQVRHVTKGHVIPGSIGPRAERPGRLRRGITDVRFDVADVVGAKRALNSSLADGFAGSMYDVSVTLPGAMGWPVSREIFDERRALPVLSACRRMVRVTLPGEGRDASLRASASSARKDSCTRPWFAPCVCCMACSYSARASSLGIPCCLAAVSQSKGRSCPSCCPRNQRS